MRVVTYAEAAKIANVKRQTVNQMKKINSENSGRYTFFAYDPATGNHGVDIDSRSWGVYIDKRRARGKIPTDSNQSINQPKNKSNKNETSLLLDALEYAVDRVLDIDRVTKGELFSVLTNRFSELVKR